MSGLHRKITKKINRLVSLFPAVVILGVRQCGKTFLASQLRPKWKYFDLEQISTRERIAYDPQFFFEENPAELIIDEAQEFPEIFKALRGAIDAQRTKPGRFIITGSSSWSLINLKAAVDRVGGPSNIVFCAIEVKLHSSPIG